MPVSSTPKELAKAVRTRNTRTTRALKKIFTNVSQYQGTAEFGLLDTPNALNSPMENWVKQRLQAQNLKPIEIDHIDAWPDEGKEKARDALVTAIKDDRAVKFLWELHPGSEEVTLIEDPDMTGGITITFRSSERNVVGGKVMVNVGP